MVIRRKTIRPRGNIRLELFRKAVHVIVGIAVVLLTQTGVLDPGVLGLLVVLMGAVVLFNFSYERELLTRIISINRPDAKIPGLDLLAYLLGMWIVLVLWPQDIAFAAILITAFGDPLAHLVSRGFGGTRTAIGRESHWYGLIAGTLAGTFAGAVYVSFVPALLASAAAMFVEAGEVHVFEHHIDDNLTIPVVSGFVLWVIALAT